jgi:hypothetical protein
MTCSGAQKVGTFKGQFSLRLCQLAARSAYESLKGRGWRQCMSRSQGKQQHPFYSVLLSPPPFQVFKSRTIQAYRRNKKRLNLSRYSFSEIFTLQSSDSLTKANWPLSANDNPHSKHSNPLHVSLYRSLIRLYPQNELPIVQ